MTHANFDKFPKDYKTFAELAEYARKRAKHSAGRNDPQAFRYWKWVHAIANELSRANATPAETLESARRILATKYENADLMATQHALAVHCRQMMLNRGEKPPRLSLNWLREAAKRL